MRIPFGLLYLAMNSPTTVKRYSGRKGLSKDQQQLKINAAEAKRSARRAKRLSAIGGIERA